jgi:nucleoporin POM152
MFEFYFSYRMNGKSRSETISTSPFGIRHQLPGEFAITSIAHQQKMCKAAVTDLRFTVHPLPAAQVAHGKGIYQDLHEGKPVVFEIRTEADMAL